MATAPNTAVALADDGRQSSSFLAAILQAATNPDIDATKVETMANLAVKLQDRERETEFNKALNAAIQEMPVISKEGIITIPAKDGKPARTQGRFARFEDIYRVVRPILERHQLALRFDVGETQQAITVRPILSHANGFTERGEAMRVPADTSGSKNAAQAVGSSTQYGKRYSMCAMLNIVTEGIDDDGRGGVAQVTLPHERETLVLQDATAAFDAGRYLEWYGSQSPKDRAWLIQSGNHTKFGGQTQLEAPKPTPPRQQPAAQPEPTQQAKPKTTREKAEVWVDWYVGEIALCTKEADIRALEEEHADTVNKLRPMADLYTKASQAADNRLATL